MRMGAAGGWLVSLVLGVGGGLAIGPAMFDIPHMAFGGAHAFDREAVAVSDGFGAAWVEDPLLERRAVHPNVRLSAPLAMGLGPDASVAFSSHGIRAQLSGAARMLISDQSDELRLERGQLLLQRTTPARVEIEDFEAAVSGASFGVWVESERWQVAALDGPATVTLGAAEVVVEPGQQRGFTKAGPEPKTFGLAERLEVELESTRRQRGKTMLSLRAAPGALARASIGEVSAEARVGADGKIELAVPALRGDVQLEVRDTLGRVAVPGRPSRTLEEVRQTLSEGRLGASWRVFSEAGALAEDAASAGGVLAKRSRVDPGE